MWTGSIWLRIRTRGDSFEHYNEPADSITYWEILEELRKLATSQEELSSMKLVTSI
jgi:hypothetical protein